MLNGKTALVTGASRGIGRAIALKFSENGANIVINYNGSESKAQETVNAINANGGHAIAVKGDISNFEGAKNVISAAIENFGRLDILVNNAGITKDGLILRMKEEDFDKVISVNLKGAFNCIRHASPIMVKQKSGRIINISSVVGLRGNPGQINYAAAKAGIIGMTKTAARELAARNITVNAIAPGFITTDMTGQLSDKTQDAILETIPMKIAGKPDDIANLATFLASDNASYITGQVICVDGGMSV